MHVQVDILARPRDGTLTIVEVKMQTPYDHAALSRTQWRRLMNVSRFLGEFEPVQMRVAFVQNQTVRLLPCDALTAF